MNRHSRPIINAVLLGLIAVLILDTVAQSTTDDAAVRNLKGSKEFASRSDIDTDNDGLNDDFETMYFTPGLLDPNKADSDGDGIGDAMDDADDDGLINRDEALHNSHPLNWDTDSDSIDDAYEILYNLGVTAFDNHAQIDFDNDGLSNLGEYRGKDGHPPFSNSQSGGAATPNPSDTRDALNPRVVDSDGDGIDDHYEFTTSNFLPHDTADGTIDFDSDDLTNIDEYLGVDGIHGTADDTDPNNPDTDADDVNDGVEVAGRTNPVDIDSDDDGISDGQEDSAPTDPLDSHDPPVARALEFMDAQGTVTVPVINNLGLRDFSIGLWIQPETTAAATLVNNGDNYVIALNDENRISVFVRTFGIGAGNIGFTGQTTLATDVWSHIFVVLDNQADRLSIYLNGVLDGETSIPARVLPVKRAGPVILGPGLTGRIDELQIWKTALSSAQVTLHFNRSHSGTETNLLAYFPFDDGQWTATGPFQSPKGAEDYAKRLDFDRSAALSSSVRFVADLTTPIDMDNDGDEMADWYEQENGLVIGVNDAGGDPDNDGLTNLSEYTRIPRTSAIHWDTDGDGLDDAYEVANGTDPTRPDSDRDGIVDMDEDDDRDGLTNRHEYFGVDDQPPYFDSENAGVHTALPNSGNVFASLHPLKRDTDGDGLGDRFEFTYFLENVLDPLVNNSDEFGLNDSFDDPDSDNLTNRDEERLGTHPHLADTDGDDLADDIEVMLGLDPLAPDSDGDGLLDGFEYDNQISGLLDPLVFDSDGDGQPDSLDDPDNDGLTNLDEQTAGTDLFDWDSDDDGLDDGYEWLYGLDPMSAGDHVNNDDDGDGVSNMDEYIGKDGQLTLLDGDGDRDGTASANILDAGDAMNPRSGDSDGDGIDDHYEYTRTSFSPVSAADRVLDFDGDGLTNFEEYGGADGAPGTGDETDPNFADTDGDFAVDGVEVKSELNPLDVDSDDDGEMDGEELSAQTDPLNSRSPLVRRTLTFTTESAIATVPVQLKYDLVDFSISMWVRPNVGGGGTLLDNDDNYRLLITEADKVALEFSSADAIPVHTRLIGNMTIPADFWTHVIGVFDTIQDRLSIYVNGALDNSITVAGDVVPAARSGPVVAGDGFAGRIDELMIWNRALSASEISTGYNRTPGRIEAGLIAWFTFDDGQWPDIGVYQSPKGAEDMTERLDFTRSMILSGAVEFLDDRAPFNPDTDGDGMPDWYETANGLSVTVNDSLVDSDGDGLTNIAEFRNFPRTSANDWDTDDDSIDDRYESFNKLDPVRTDGDHDVDNDGLSNVVEYRGRDGIPPLLANGPDGVAAKNVADLGDELNPRKRDTDGDGLSDGFEFNHFNGGILNPKLRDSNQNSLIDGLEDFDGDGLDNLGEEAAGTDPTDWDTDDDDIDDRFEYHHRTGLNPATSDDHQNVDADMDGLTNWQEYTGVDLTPPLVDPNGDNDGNAEINPGNTRGSLNPTSADTDGDGLSDAFEFAHFRPLLLDPLTADSNNDTLGDLVEDPDHDGLTNEIEQSRQTNPLHWDSDGDGLDDAYEISFLFDPATTDNHDTLDTDGDGLFNIEEYRGSDNEAPLIDPDDDGIASVNALDTAPSLNPLVTDTDADGLGDRFEARFYSPGVLDGLIADSDADGLGDALEDPDADELTNREEELAGTNPLLADTDGDGLDDFFEVAFDLNPNAVDTDGDGVSDFFEVGFYVEGELDPALFNTDGIGPNDGDEDFDGEGLINRAESEWSTNPRNPDTDFDTLNDFVEVSQGTDPTRPTPIYPLGWSLFSMPWNSASSVSLADQLDQNRVQSVWTWQNRRFNRVSSSNPAADKLMPGNGYWILSSVAHANDIPGDRVSGVSRSLKKGWNLIGATDVGFLPMNEALIDAIWTWDGTRYVRATRAVEPFKAYWIYALDDVVIELP